MKPSAILPSVLAFFALAGLPLGPTRPANATLRPFVYAGGQAISSEKTDLDEWLDEFTIKTAVGSWQAGAGLRAVTFHRPDEGSIGGPSWEVRLRAGVGGGNLPGTLVKGTRVIDRNSFSFSSDETLSYFSWDFGVAVRAHISRLLGGFYLEPGVQSVKYKAERAWSGPSGCTACGPGSDKETVRYGLIEVGAFWHPFSFPLNLEGYWTPKRYQLSSSRILKNANYKANFASFRHSVGARLSYDF